MFTVVMENVVDTPSLLFGTQRSFENCLIEADKRKMVSERKERR